MVLRIFAALAGLLLVLLTLTYEAIKPPWTYWLVVAGVVIFVVASIQAYHERRKEMYSSETGVLKPMRRHTSVHLDGKEDGLTIRLGTSATYLTWVGHVQDPNPDFTKPQKIFMAMDDTADYNVYIWFEGGLLRLRVKLYDRSLNLIGSIDGNRWYVNRPLGCQINFNKEAFEIVNSYGKVQLQVVLYTNIIQLAYFSYSPIGGWANINGKMERFPATEYPTDTIEPIFQYPASAYPGKRA